MSLMLQILKFVDDSSKGTICIIPKTFSSSQDHYQGNIYAIGKLNVFSI